MWVKYFIPEDGDEPEHPNVFNIKIQGSLTLDQLEKVSTFQTQTV